MPVKKTTTRTLSARKKTVIAAEPAEQAWESAETPIEKLTKPRNYIPLLIVALLMVSFMLGMAFMKIQYLENQVKQAGTQANANAQGTNPGVPSAPPAHVNVANGHFPVLGQDSAKVTIVEFADLRCPFCHQFFTDTLPQLKSDYIDTGKVKFYWRSYAFLGPASTTASNAIECANEQGKFWDMHNYLYQNQPDESDTSMYTTDKLTEIAGNIGVGNTDQFRSCLDSKKYDKNVSADLADGQKAGVSGTPTFFINGTTLVGAQPYSAIKTVIDQELAKVQ